MRIEVAASNVAQVVAASERWLGVRAGPGGLVTTDCQYISQLFAGASLRALVEICTLASQLSHIL